MVTTTIYIQCPSSQLFLPDAQYLVAYLLLPDIRAAWSCVVVTARDVRAITFLVVATTRDVHIKWVTDYFDISCASTLTEASPIKLIFPFSFNISCSCDCVVVVVTVVVPVVLLQDNK